MSAGVASSSSAPAWRPCHAPLPARPHLSVWCWEARAIVVSTTSYEAIFLRGVADSLGGAAAPGCQPAGVCGCTRDTAGPWQRGHWQPVAAAPQSHSLAVQHARVALGVLGPLQDLEVRLGGLADLILPVQGGGTTEHHGARAGGWDQRRRFRTQLPAPPHSAHSSRPAPLPAPATHHWSISEGGATTSVSPCGMLLRTEAAGAGQRRVLAVSGRP